MEAKELRIGNLFIEKHSDQIIEVIELKQNEIVFSGKFPYEWQAEPIPLTEEWYMKIKKTSIVSVDCEINFRLEYDCVKMYINDCFIKKIDHVHYMQNIWYDLTGQELEFKD